MAVNVTLTAEQTAYPKVLQITGIGTTWQAVAMPTAPGPWNILVTASAAFYVSWGSATDDGGAVVHSHTVAAGGSINQDLSPEDGKRSHLLLAAQSGTMTANITLGRG